MDTTGKIIVWVVVILIILGGLFYWYEYMHTPKVSTSMTATSSAMLPSAAATAAANPLPAGTSTSDAALSQDTAAIDAQMNGLDSDNTNMTSSVNQPAQ
jgi:hypothetical protein